MNGRSSEQKPGGSPIIPNASGVSIAASKAGGSKRSAVYGMRRHADEGREKSRRNRGGLRMPSPRGHNARQRRPCRGFPAFLRKVKGWVAIHIQSYKDGLHLPKTPCFQGEKERLPFARPPSVIFMEVMLMILSPVRENTTHTIFYPTFRKETSEDAHK